MILAIAKRANHTYAVGDIRDSHCQCLHTPIHSSVSQTPVLHEPRQFDEQFQTRSNWGTIPVRLREIGSVTYLTKICVRHGEGGRYPAIGIDNVLGYLLDYAGDRATDVLGGREYRRGRQQQHHGQLVVHPEQRRIGPDRRRLQVLT